MKSFTIYEEYYELIKCLNDKDRFAMYDAIFKYMFDGIDPLFIGLKNGIWVNLKRPLDKSKNNSKRSTGNGAPTGNQNASKIQTENKPNSNQIQTENKPNSNQIQTENKPKTNTSNDVNVNVNNYDSNYDVNVNNLFNYIEDNFRRTLTPIEYEEISKWEDNELTRYAIKQAILNSAYSIKYINGILQNYKNRNITSVQQAQKDENNFQKRKGKNQKEKFLTPREMRDLEFEKLRKKYESEESYDNK